MNKYTCPVCLGRGRLKDKEVDCHNCGGRGILRPVPEFTTECGIGHHDDCQGVLRNIPGPGQDEEVFECLCECHHDPDDDFTADDQLDVMMINMADQMKKQQWLNVLQHLNEIEAVILQRFNDVLKGRTDGDSEH